MFKYISGETSGKEAELAATVEHTAGYLGLEIEENEKLRARMDAAIRILSDDRLSLQNRINSARSMLAYWT